ncbi:hypothetical protein [Bdellovibrio svalbardensis]|uniref:Outer membrane beta-barrel domain-containing protein n=1 Tax=Bdellovibrio svalbardensis TaxID=2972972 RepID=A0ABT6DF64_9BACT|nr:hypothetical protein [Bdellovibrio svalbardensis]MDG0815486.1 hypothetical protein [Bdellovibrio svalbardensis]
MKLCRLLLFIGLSLSVVLAEAAADLPKNLTTSDQIRALEILGLGTSSKVLDNPYPLGGYTGFEVGLTSEFIPMEDLSKLGSKTSDSGEFNYYTLTLGKGLYYNVDTLFYFTPAIQTQKVQSFGGQVRWGFYEASFFPISFSAMAYAGGANFSNLINVTTLGFDLIATVAIDNVALYFGEGRINAQGTFIGGADGITATKETEKQYVTEAHTLAGLNVNIAKFFVALEIDRYVDSVYSGKLGFRF